jgi:orotate phosphoribosyltransferase
MQVDDIVEIQDRLRRADGRPCPQHIASIIAETGALLRGHFRLQSGLHSSYFLRAAQLLFRRDHASLFASELVPVLNARGLHVVLSASSAPAFLARSIAEQLGIPYALVATDEKRRPIGELTEGKVEQKQSVLIVTDVVTTGGAHDVLRRFCDEIGAIAVVSASLAVLNSSWLQDPNHVGIFRAEWEIVQPTECPICRAGGASLWPAHELV